MTVVLNDRKIGRHYKGEHYVDADKQVDLIVPLKNNNTYFLPGALWYVMTYYGFSGLGVFWRDTQSAVSYKVINMAIYSWLVCCDGCLCLALSHAYMILVDIL